MMMVIIIAFLARSSGATCYNDCERRGSLLFIFLALSELETPVVAFALTYCTTAGQLLTTDEEHGLEGVMISMI